MTLNELAHYKHRMHHRAIFHMKDGSTVEGNMQPNDERYVYITINEGASGGKVEISNIKKIEFPDD